MEANELLIFAIKVLAEARQELDTQASELRNQRFFADSSRIGSIVDNIDELVTAIRIYQLPE